MTQNIIVTAIGLIVFLLIIYRIFKKKDNPCSNCGESLNGCKACDKKNRL